MDKASIIKFSDTIRDRLYEETKNRAAYYGIFPDKIQDVDKEFEDSIVIGGRVFNRKIKKQREQLVREVREKGYDQLIDEVTYTWFNRFVALKFMEVNGYLPENVKVFSSNEMGKTEPDILSKSLKLDFLNVDRNAVIEFKSASKDEELYKYLTLSLCNYLNKIMPFLFENIEDHTELLFPDKLLHTDSILRDINSIIKEEDWKEVEIIGWIYQDYINPRKTKVFADLKKNIKISKENIPAATQLFTPKWIVKYLVENSLGRLWLESNPNKDLQSKFRYFIEQGTRPPEKKISSPEEISVLDPAKGSGHILVYSFEVLYEIYRSQGYLESEIAPLILNKNLYGLEIDDRAAQLAGFALMMKARMYDKELFNKKISLNLCAIQETREECTLNRGKYPELCRLWDFFIDAKNYGSLLKVEGFDFEKLTGEIELLKNEGTLDFPFVGSKLEELVKQAKLMSRKYDCVVTNPPYMGSKGMNSKLREFVNKEYPASKSDLMTCFMEKGMEFLYDAGFLAMINIPSWMFLSTFQKFRETILKTNTIYSLLHLGRGIFGSDFGTVSFVINKNKILNFKGVYRKLYLKHGAVDSIKQKEMWFLDRMFGFYISDQQDFLRIPGSPISYWVSTKVRNIFINSPLYDYTISDGQNKTGNNERFLRNIWEVDEDKIIQHNKKGYKWIFYAKGGDFRRWYGNIEFLINWSEESRKHYRKDKIARLIPEYLWFKKGISWSLISSGNNVGFRILLENSTFDVAGSSIFLKDDEINNYYYFLSFLNTKLVGLLFKILNPTISLQVKDIRSLPIIFPKTSEQMNKIDQLTQECVIISREEWDSREISWDFKKNELLRHKSSGRLNDANDSYCSYWKEKFQKLHSNEVELNRIFIDIYDLADEITPDVPIYDITILRDESEIKEGELVFKKEAIIKQFISYAVGCMFGRYSPDKEGLILANKGENIEDFLAKVPAPSFMPDDDNIIPVLEDEYFKDDIVTRFKEFLKVTFGAETLADNLDFIAGALSKSKKGGESSENIIRDYFLKSFFKDHVRTYQKRPIYWLFTSGKGRGFNALVYMHRYDKTLLAKMRTDYLLELEAKLEARIAMLSESPRDKQEMERLGKLMQELAAYDEMLNNRALGFIDIDLDDGVAVNYRKFEGLVEGV
ncbi:MAG: BREX-1 system adenine-specific DNA-methyltransferase PglX [Candidatus Methanoperedens sp.]